MKISICQFNYHIGDLEGNFKKIAEGIEQAKKEAADLVVFSELSLSGYPPRDLLDYPSFIEQVEIYINRLAKLSVGIDILVGAPRVNPSNYGKGLFNSVYHLSQGEVKSIVDKTLLPTYDIFDEARYFESNNKFELIEIGKERLAVLICEDIWNEQNHLYELDPLVKLMELDPTQIICLSASPFDYEHLENRRNLLSGLAAKYQLPMTYINQIGSYTDIVFDGGSMVFNSKGELQAELPLFKEMQSFVDTNDSHSITPSSTEKIALIHDALLIGIRDYFQKLGFKKAIVGLSGGIDSAIVTTMAVKALGAENVNVIMMPSQYSSDHSISDSEQLIQNLGIQGDLIAIEEIYKSFEKGLAPLFEGKEADLTEENLQARIRGTLLMAYSNKFGNILLNTSNKSEMAVGYSTIYGDMNGGLSVMGDLFKTEVFELARFINREKEIIPNHILIKPPSAELRPDQKDSDSLPDYDILDDILYQYVDLRKGVQQIIDAGFEKSLVERIIRLVNMNEYKRYQSPPIIKVSTKAFGTGRRMPIVAKITN